MCRVVADTGARGQKTTCSKPAPSTIAARSPRSFAHAEKRCAGEAQAATVSPRSPRKETIVRRRDTRQSYAG
jgi:hypothetical protein